MATELQLTEQVNAQNAAGVSPQTSETKTPTPSTAVDWIKRWVADDEDIDMSERMAAENMIENLEQAADFEISTEQAKELVSLYAPNAPHRIAKIVAAKPTSAYPAELQPLVESGVAFLSDDGTNTWLLSRCMTCGQFAGCGHDNKTVVAAVREFDGQLTGFARQAVGLSPIVVPQPPKSLEQLHVERVEGLSADTAEWWKHFRSYDELEGDGNVKMYVENVLPDGITLICGPMKEGKSFFAMSIAKALTTGEPLFGRIGYEVSEKIPVLFLAAESGDIQLKLRCKKFGITTDKKLFMARTLTQGVMLGLDDPIIKQVLDDLRPVVILETLVRFNEGASEDSASESRKLANLLFRLREHGARAVIAIHHSRKDIDRRKPSKEAAVRGSGDLLAMADMIWLLYRDLNLTDANEVNVVGWGRDFEPPKMRLALTRKKQAGDTMPDFSEGTVSVIDATGDFGWVSRGIKFDAEDHQIDADVERVITAEPTLNRPGIAKATGHTEWRVKAALKRLGYRKGQGGFGKTLWTKASDESIG